MTINHHIETFFGLKIEAYDYNKGIQDSNSAIRLEIDYDDADDGLKMIKVLSSLANEQKSEQIQALIIGAWEEPYEESAQQYINFLIENKSQFKNLKAFFFAEMTMEENEISWIQQGDYSKFWSAYPDLLHFQVRGSEGLNLGDIDAPSLQKLIIETGGLPAKIINQITQAKVPALNHLELWLGDENYGWDGSIDDVFPLMSKNKFPLLRYLAIKNSEIEDDIAIKIAQSDILSQLQFLDLSMGLMTDKGAEALYTQKDMMLNLELLNVSENYLTAAMTKKLSTLLLNVDTSEQKEMDEDDDDYRYVSVSE